MILNALYELYKRLADDPEIEIDRPGLSKANVSFELVLTPDGALTGVTDLRKQQGKKLQPIQMMVPQQFKRTSGDRSYLLCDKSDYLLGVGPDGTPTEASLRRFALAKAMHQEALGGVPEAAPVLKFFESWKPEEAAANPILAGRFEDLAGTGLIVFRVAGESQRVHEIPAVKAAAGGFMEGGGKTDTAFCLVTGELTTVSQVHNSIKGVRNAGTMGAALISFNCDAFKSYGKEQSVNAPVSVDAARGYVAALNWLIADRGHHLQLGDATTVFWAEAPKAEPLMNALLGGGPPAAEGTGEPDEARRKMEGILSRVAKGARVDEALLGFPPEVKTYILGLAPNNSRLAVRFWHQDSFGNLVERVSRHYQDLSLERQFESQKEYLTPYDLLIEMAARRDMGQLPDVLTGGLMRAILTGELYPDGVYAAVLERIRANDGGRDARGNPLNPVSYARASMIKAVLTRRARILRNTEEECLTMSLNQSTDIGYRLGRLFAALEKAQQDANPGINTTIRDSYFTTASTSPGSVFPNLIHLAQHHIAKSDYGYVSDRRIEEILWDLNDIPARLDVEQQGRFILGYYHQRHDFYLKKPDNEKGE